MTQQQKHIPKLRFPEFKGEWEEKKLGEVFTIGSGRDYKHLETGNIPVYGTGGYMTSVNDFLYDGESVCIGRKGTIDKPVLLNGKFWTVDTLFYTHSFVNSIPSFVYLLFQNIDWKKHNEASGVPSLSKATIEKIETNIPPLPEQQKIANFLTAIDGLLAKLQEKKSLLAEYKTGAMQQIFEQKIRFTDDHGNQYPDWEEKKLGDIANFRRGSFPQPYGLPEWYDEVYGMPFVQVYDVDTNFLLKPTTKQKISKKAQPQSVFVKSGSLVLTIQGSIGRIAITQYDCYVDRTLLIFTGFNEPIDIAFFSQIVFLLFETEKTKAPGGTIKTITKEALSGFTLKLPILSEQQKIANFLTAIDAKIKAVAEQIEQAQSYKKVLLQQMFV